MKNFKLNSQEGFSLVELMTVVAIMGTLAAVAVPRFSSSSDKVKQTQVQTDTLVASTAVSSMHLNLKSVIQSFQATNASPGNCVACAQGWQVGTSPSTWGNIAAGDAAWRALGYPKTPLDPWGEPYILDDNDGEFGERDCRYDAIYSAGPDRKFAGAGDGDDVYGDDVIVRLPHVKRSGTFQCPTDDINSQYGGRQM